MGKYIRDILLVVTGIFFAFMWSLLLRRHLVGEELSLAPAAYETLLEPEEQQREYKMGIYFLGRRFGTTHATVKRAPAGSIELSNETQMELGEALLPVLGLAGHLDFYFSARVQPLSGLHSFRLTSKKLDLTLMGVRKAQRLSVRGSFGERKIDTTLPFSRGRVLGELFSPLGGLPQLDAESVGHRWEIHMVNPFSGRVRPVRVTVAESKRLNFDGEDMQAFLLVFRLNNRQWDSWVTAEGTPLIQGTPVGLVLRREDLPDSLLEKLERGGAGGEQ